MKMFWQTKKAALAAAPAGEALPVLWAKKKKRKAPPPPSPAKKKPKNKPIATAKRRNDNWAMRLEKSMGNWFSGNGLAGYGNREWGQLGILFGGLVLVLLIYSFSAGGYFIIRRGWGELIVLYLIVLGLLFGISVKGRASRLAMAEAGLFGAYGLWILLSVTWSIIPTDSFQEFLRAMLYLGGFGLFYLFMARRRWLPWLGQAFVLIAFTVAVATLLHDKIFAPAQFDFDARISWPLTYWNTIALMMVMAVPVALLQAGRKSASLILRMVNAPIIFLLLVALYFTFSRAGYILLLLALAIYVLFAVERLRALLIAATAFFWTGAVVASCYAFLPAMNALCNFDKNSCPTGPTVAVRASQAHTLGILLPIFFAAAIVTQYLFWRIDGKVSLSPAVARKVGIGLGAAAVAVLLLGATFFMIRDGGPVALVRKQFDKLSSTTVSQQAATAQQRLFSTETQRPQEYKVSLDTFAAHPLTGTGAATWQVAWLQKRPAFTTNGVVREIPIKNGHSIFFDAMAELGIVGAGLLAAFIVVFFVGSIRDLRFLGRSRHREVYGAFFAACTVLILHSLMDWDWQMPVIFLSFFFFAGGLLRYGLISRQLAESAGGAATDKEKSDGFSIRSWLSWKTIVATGCIIIGIVTIFSMLSERYLEDSNQELQAGSQLLNQKQGVEAQQFFTNAESLAARAHTFNPLDGTALTYEAEAVQQEGIFLSEQGQAQQGSRKFSQALNFWHQALDREPDNYKVYYDLGAFYLGTNHINKAAQNTRKARQLDPLESQLLGPLEVQIRKEPGGYKALGY